MSIIKSQSNASQIAVSKARSQPVLALPPFSYPGKLAKNKESGRYFPRVGIALNYYTVSLRTTGTSTSSLVFKMRNPIDGQGEIVFATVGIPANKKYIKGTFNNNTVLNASDWVSVLINTAGGHQDLVVSFYGTPSEIGYHEITD